MSKDTPQHFYLATIQFFYNRDGALKQRTMNSVMELKRKAITAHNLNDVRRASLQRLYEENGIPHDQISDMVVLGITYLGVMSPADFHAAPTPSTPQH